MEKIEKVLKLGMFCFLLLVCVAKEQKELVSNSYNAQEKSQDEREQEKGVQVSGSKSMTGDLNKETESKDVESEDTESKDTGYEGQQASSIEVNADNNYTIMGTNGVTKEQMVAFFQASGHTYPAEALGEGGAPAIEDYCQMFLEESEAEGVRGEIPYVQSMKETGWLQFQGVCDIYQYNFAGLGATGGDVAGESYPDVRTGIRAQVQHLKAYATTDPLTEACVDTRYALVLKASAPYVEWLGQQENPQGAGWAVDSGYGISIAEMIQNLKTF